MKEHEKTHSEKFNCEQCKQNFNDKFKLDQHTCPKTQKTQERLQQLAQNGKNNPVPDKLFCCSKCDQEFKSKDDLKKHERTHDKDSKDASSHEGDKQFTCKQCDKKFSSLDDMKVHRKIHICPFLQENKCRFGASGKKQNGACSFAHPRLCIYYQNMGRCKKGDNCDFLHTNNGNDHSGAHNATRGFRQKQGGNPPGDMSFLGDGFL